jgi:hypothetical protein
VIELTQTVKNESPTIQERVTTPVGSDISTTCIMVWFVFAFAMFLVDFRGSKQSQIEDQILTGHRY